MSRSLRAGTASPTVVAIGAVARQLGLPDPVANADDLINVDVDALDEWFALAARAQLWLYQGSTRLDDAVPLVGAGWSSPAPRLAITRQREAGLASRAVVAAQVDAADATVATLRQARVLADAELAEAEQTVLATGWQAGDDLLVWAAMHDQLPTVMRVVTGLAGRLDELGRRNAEALKALAVALRSDPLNPVEEIARVWPARGQQSMPNGPGPNSTDHRSTGDGIDTDNLDRLAADLRSSDLATLTMALGVQAALDRARAAGGVAQLLVYESAGSGGQGRAAISVGDITTADNVATLTPGVGNAAASMSGGVATAAALRDQARQQAPDDETAVVAWYGYDIPLSYAAGAPEDALSAIGDTVSALDDDTARAGGNLLVQDLDRFHQLAPGTARFVAIGFSMGSTVVSAAAASGGKLDDIVLLGSPGASVEVDTAGDYPELPADHAFVGLVRAGSGHPAVDRPARRNRRRHRFDGQPLRCLWPADAVRRDAVPAQLNPYGPDPASKEFGAQVMDVQTSNPDPTVSLQVGDPLTSLIASGLANEVVDLASHHQESNYLSGDSLDAVASVVVGHYTEVPVKPGR